MPRFYRKYLNKTLADAIEEQLGCSPNEQVSLYEELALIRHMAIQAVKLYDVALQSNKAQPLAMAMPMLRDALGEVRVYCESIARIEASTKEKFSIHNLAHVVNQITRVAYEVLEPVDPELAIKFEETLRESLKIHDDGQSGTVITPDQDVIDMDDTVPKENYDSERKDG